MRFLFKLFVLGFIGLAVLPAFAPEEYKADAQAETADGTPSAYAVAALVGQAVADISEICVRNPELCETGREVLAYTGTKAREGLVIAYAMFRHGHPSMKDKAEQSMEAPAKSG